MQSRAGCASSRGNRRETPAGNPRCADDGAGGLCRVRDRGLVFVFRARGAPRPIAEKLHGALSEIIRSPEISAFLVAEARYPTGIGLDEFARTVAAERAAWAKLIKDNDIRLD